MTTMTKEQIQALRDNTVAEFLARAQELDAMAQQLKGGVNLYVVQTSPGLYLLPAVNGVHRVSSIAKAERFTSPKAQELARELRSSDQKECEPVVRERRAALLHEAAELRRLAGLIAQTGEE